MIPAAFDYTRAESVDHAVQLLGEHGEDAKLLAGGHSLLPLMKLRLARPSVLVDIDRLSDLEYVESTRNGVKVGALTRMHALASNDLLAQACPLLAYTAGQVGDPQVRHRATIGGSIAHGDPAGDLPAVLLALDAQMMTMGPNGERTIGAAEFFKGVFETALGPQDVLTEIRIDTMGMGSRWSYQKFHRRAIDWAIVGVAALVDTDDGHISKASIALTNMGSVPIRATGVEHALAGSPTSTEALASAAAHAPEGTNPVSDANASAEYRSELSKVLVRRAVEEALAR